MTDLFRMPSVGRAPVQGTDRSAEQAKEYAKEPAVPPAVLPETVWEVSVRPEDTNDPAWRSRLLGHVRTAVEVKLREDPAARGLTWPTPLGTVEARPRGDRTEPGGPIRLAFAPPPAGANGGERAVSNRLTPSARQGDSGRDLAEALPALRLPDEPTRLLGERLVGLDTARQAVLLRWGCAWDGALEAWALKAQSPVSTAFRDYLANGHAVSLFHGVPGTGKSALAKVLADDYARRHGIGGTVLWLTTQARGLGLVGDFSRRLRAAFAQLAALPDDEVRVLVVDEADALTMRRSEANGHQEDRAATATLLQCLDEIAGQRRLAVILTSNVLNGIDPAVQRRSHLFAFELPDVEARTALLARWLPHLNASDLGRAALEATGMTPADIDRALGAAWLGAVGAGAGLTAAAAVSALRQGARTGSV